MRSYSIRQLRSKTPVKFPQTAPNRPKLFAVADSGEARQSGVLQNGKPHGGRQLNHFLNVSLSPPLSTFPADLDAISTGVKKFPNGNKIREIIAQLTRFWIEPVSLW